MIEKKWISTVMSILLTLGMILVLPLQSLAETEITDGQETLTEEGNAEDIIAAFTDVDLQEWYHDGISYVVEKGIMVGTGDNTFEPDSLSTRAMIVTMLWRMEGKPEAEAAGFTDLDKNNWYSTAVGWATENQIVNGYDEKTFAPMDYVTREQLAVILYRYEQFKNRVNDEFLDTNLLEYDDYSDMSSWAEEALRWAAGGQIIQGRTETTLVPGGCATRAEIATMFMRYCTISRVLWDYSYAGVEHPYLSAISDYLCSIDAEKPEAGYGMIPCITSIEVDNDNDNDIKMWGIFDIYHYSLSDRTLIEENGKRLLGVFHLMQNENGTCSVTEADFVDEGDEKAIDELCEGHQMALEGLKNPIVTEETRRWFISEFVKSKGLDVLQYQPADSSPLPINYEKQNSPDWVTSLPEASETDSLIVVDITIGSNAILTMHEKNNEGIWEQTVDEAAFIGKNGPGKTREGDLKTPLGTFGFNAAFGINDDPGCAAFDYLKVDDSHYWDADSESDHYNTMVSTDDYSDFNMEDSEHIVDYPNAYKYVLNTTYNEDGTPGQGSAIFLHCYREQRTYTGGCVSIPLETMEYVMKNVQKDSKIVISKREA